MLFYSNDKISIYNDDILKRDMFQPNSFDLTVTSPPYNVGIEYNSNDDTITYEEYLIWTQKWLENLLYWTKDTGRLCLNIPLDKNKGGKKSVGSDITQIAKNIGWQYQTTIIWNEGNISRRTAWGSWLSASAPYVIAPVELIVVFYKKEWKKNYKGQSDILKQEFMDWTNGVWTFNGESKKRIGHPAPYPRELPKRCIKLFSYAKDTIFDPFLGSGTTLIEASINNRKGIGVDISKEYCNLAKKRIIDEVGLF
jgi:site-specific DNA-methyltransferase (adenine-specific)